LCIFFEIISICLLIDYISWIIFWNFWNKNRFDQFNSVFYQSFHLLAILNKNNIFKNFINLTHYAIYHFYPSIKTKILSYDLALKLAIRFLYILQIFFKKLEKNQLNRLIKFEIYFLKCNLFNDANRLNDSNRISDIIYINFYIIIN